MAADGIDHHNAVRCYTVLRRPIYSQHPQAFLDGMKAFDCATMLRNKLEERLAQVDAAWRKVHRCVRLLAIVCVCT